MTGTGQQFIMVGERTNVTRYTKYRKLVEGGPVAAAGWASPASRSKAAPTSST